MPLHRTLRAAVVLGLGVVLYRVARERALGLGTTEAERMAPLPGDELLPGADLVATRGIDVDAPPGDVWPWLVQMGQGRGGFYSYEALENLLGLDIHNADRVRPEWQDLAVGDEVRLAAQAGLVAAVVQPDEALVLQGAAPVPADELDSCGAEGTDVGPGQGEAPFDFTWAFVLQPWGAHGTRLLVRERYRYRTSWAGRMVEPVSWVSLLMTERMLRGIRDRAEQSRG
ncbi:SRPBCC family protein [Actinotalea sp. C106]|uniref:SRPBCC family protein n=1 Tax=Actinotalea sp. C106 TaxID=2908644 RepID=UPI002028EE26|nr:SRPBCC family protein [Actinotalea sp. C106]